MTSGALTNLHRAWCGNRFALAACVCLTVFAPQTLADNGGFAATASDFGTTGLLQTPSARMYEDGALVVHKANIRPYDHTLFAVQILPAVEALFRYTSVKNQRYNRTSHLDYLDKSFDFKFKLIDESYYWPQIALGFRDIGGTGLFSGEYLVANKQFGRFDVSMGLGWGYAVASDGGYNNPLAQLNARFAQDRAQLNEVGQGGTVSVDAMFSGQKVALFGGVAYRPAWWPEAVFKLEYDANDYRAEPFNQPINATSHINAGLLWRPNRHWGWQVSWQRGQQYGLALTYYLNAQQKNIFPEKLADPKPPNTSDLIAQKHQAVSPSLALTEQVVEPLRANAGLAVHHLELNDKQLMVMAEDSRYRQALKTLSRQVKVVNQQSQGAVEQSTWHQLRRGLHLGSIVADTEDFIALDKGLRTPDEVWRNLRFTPAALAVADAASTLGRPAQPVSLSLTPYLNHSFGGADASYLFQVGAHLGLRWQPALNVWLDSAVTLAVFDNYEKFNYTADSRLPRVRTHIREYLTASKTQLRQLQLNYVKQFDNNLFGAVYGGILETMYGGIGAEVLYRPWGKNWAVGLDVNWLRKRSFAQDLSFLDYTTQTGHLSVYYRWPWYGLHSSVSYGKYLAGDYGVTVDINRMFASGIRVGAWASRTNVPYVVFGEGSFDKGVYITIPFDAFMLRSSKEQANVKWRFLTRDGGQKLNKSLNLYPLTTEELYQTARPDVDVLRQ